MAEQVYRVELTATFLERLDAIEAFLTAAKKRLPRGIAFAGEQQPTRPQVKALWEELRARGFSYVNDPRVFIPAGWAQRTRLPADVLRSTNAQSSWPRIRQRSRNRRPRLQADVGRGFGGGKYKDLRQIAVKAAVGRAC